jgi:hypothetical protein
MPSPLRTAAVLLAVALPACGLAQCGGDAKPAAKAEATPRPAGSACTVHVDPASFVGEFSAAEPGDVLCLASGRYQPFVGAEEADKVTIRAEKGARPRLPFDFDGATNLVLEGLTIPLGRLAGATRDITIRDSAFTGPLTIEGLADANVLLEHNTHLDIDAPPGASPARIHLNYSARAPSGVTIRDSLFAGGDADGIQTGVGVEIVDNEFRDILEKGPNHTDAIQLIGARGSVIRGNYIHDSSSGIVAYDGVNHVTIEDNVIALAGRPWAVELYSDAGSVVRHNTLAPGACDYDLPCGILEVNRKPGDPRGRGTEVTANVAADISIQNGSTLAARSGNLLGASAALEGDEAGTPVFVGGASPDRWGGFRLAGSSPGAGTASGGADVGIRAR